MVNRETQFDVSIPDEDYDWHCKYVIQASQSLINGITYDDQNDKGYLYVEGTQHGFDEEVWVIVQPRGEFYDYSSTHPKNLVTKVYKAVLGRKFLIPAELDVLILFSPLRKDGSNARTSNGSFKIKTKYETVIPQHLKDDEDVKIQWRPCDYDVEILLSDGSC